MDTPMREWPFGGAGRAIWPRAGREWPRLRRGRAPDPWAEDVEAYPGAAALEDVVAGVGSEGSERAAAAAAARAVVTQLAMAAEEGLLKGDALEEARALAAAHVRASGCGRAEAAALAAVVGLVAEEPEAVLAGALDDAAAAAAAAGCRGGAASLWRAGYRVARRRRWPAQAALAATGMESLARAAGSRAAARLWHARAERLARRAG